MDKLCRIITKVRKDNNLGYDDITVRWISGHNGVEGNEHADKEAKEAAKGPRSNSARRKLPVYLHTGILPTSTSTIKQAQKSQSKDRWSQLWSLSPRHALASTYQAMLPSSAF
ncbi:hypothetical protein BU15DRAFT_41030, partial [Melanogaster broomeanus]